MRQGEFVQVRQELYANIDQIIAGMIDIETFILGDILWFWSEWSIHHLTISMLQAFYVNHKRIQKVVTHAYPPIELYHYKASILRNRCNKDERGGIYDIERCDCDATKFRNKVDMNICSEIINNSLARSERNISKLLDYAQQLHIEIILKIIYNVSIR